MKKKKRVTAHPPTETYHVSMACFSGWAGGHTERRQRGEMTYTSHPPSRTYPITSITQADSEKRQVKQAERPLKPEQQATTSVAEKMITQSHTIQSAVVAVDSIESQRQGRAQSIQTSQESRRDLSSWSNWLAPIQLSGKPHNHTFIESSQPARSQSRAEQSLFR